GPPRARGPDRPRHLRLDHGGAAPGARRSEVRAVPAPARAPRRRTARAQVRTRLLRLRLMGGGLAARSLPTRRATPSSANRRAPPRLPPTSLGAVDFELTSEQREIQRLTRELAEAEIVPNAPAWDREHRFP